MTTQPNSLADAAERTAALDLSVHALVMAPAGSGKTGLLVARLLRALATVRDPEQVVAITFTNKAAAEIRHRVMELLTAAQEARPAGHLPEAFAAAVELLEHERKVGWHLLDQPERLRAMTIDSFNAQLAAQQPLLSGLGGRLATVDDARGLYVDAIMSLFADLERDDLPEADREALQIVLRLADNRIDRLIEPLSDLIARRDQWLNQLGRIGNEADGTENQLLRRIVLPALTEFGAVLGDDRRDALIGILREGADESALLDWARGLDTWPDQDEAGQPLLAHIAAALLTASGDLRKSVTVRDGFVAKRPYTQRMRTLLSESEGDSPLERAARLVRDLPDMSYPAQLKPVQQALLRTMRLLAGHLRLVFGERGHSDFTEIALSALDALRPSGEAEGLFGDALLAADRRIRHLLVDEMQDTSEVQIRLLTQLTAEWQDGDGRSLFLVGDPQQSIYAFRNAQVCLFLELWQRGRLERLSLRCLRLSANFRSDANVVDWFNQAFATIFPQTVDAELGAVPFAASQAQRPSGQGGVQSQWFGANDDAAAEAAALRAQQLAADGATVAVLGRTRAHLAPVIRALRSAGHTPACQDIDPLASEPAVRDYVALVRALWHPADRLYWAVLLRAPFVGLSWGDLLALSVGAMRRSWPERIRLALASDEAVAISAEGRQRLMRLQTVLRATADDPALRSELSERAETVWHALGGASCIDADELTDVMSAMRLVREHTRGGTIEDLDALERGLDALYAEPRAGQVQVMTVHKAKGLEFDHVLLVGCNRASRPESRPFWHLKRSGDDHLLVPKPPASFGDDDPAHRLYAYVHGRQIIERRNETLRLLYVAVTRARRSLTLYVESKPDKAGQPRLTPGSFAQLLQPMIIGEAQALPPAQAVEDDWLPPPRAPRLPADFAVQPDADDQQVYRPQERRTLKPSEAVLNATEDRREQRTEPSGDLYAQLIGTLYHEALERIAQQGLDAWADGGASRAAALRSGFRRMGLPEPQVEPALARVLHMLGRTLASDTARWLLGAKRWSRNEYALAGYLDGRWVSAVIDRCFEDDDGTLWVVDYKTAAQAVGDDRIETYVAKGIERYRDQLAVYARLLAEVRGGGRVRTALYFADADRLEEIETDA